MDPEERKRRDRERKRKKYHEDPEHREAKRAANRAAAASRWATMTEAEKAEAQDRNTKYQQDRCRTDPEYHERRKENTRAWKFRHVAKLREAIARAKDQPCVDCGTKFHPAAMDFDHVRGEKKFNISKSATLGRSLKEIMEEIAKCEIRCANCHRIRHALAINGTLGP